MRSMDGPYGEMVKGTETILWYGEKVFEGVGQQRGGVPFWGQSIEKGANKGPQ